MCITSFRISHPVLPGVFHFFFCVSGGCGFYLPGLSHSGIKEYGQMHPEVQDQDKHAPYINFILPLDNKQFFHNAI